MLSVSRLEHLYEQKIVLGLSTCCTIVTLFSKHSIRKTEMTCVDASSSMDYLVAWAWACAWGAMRWKAKNTDDSHHNKTTAARAYAVFAFLPRTFLGGAGFFSFWAAMSAETRARAAWVSEYVRSILVGCATDWC